MTIPAVKPENFGASRINTKLVSRHGAAPKRTCRSSALQDCLTHNISNAVINGGASSARIIPSEQDF